MRYFQGSIKDFWGTGWNKVVPPKLVKQVYILLLNITHDHGEILWKAPSLYYFFWKKHLKVTLLTLLSVQGPLQVGAGLKSHKINMALDTLASPPPGPPDPPSPPECHGPCCKLSFQYRFAAIPFNLTKIDHNHLLYVFVWHFPCYLWLALICIVLEFLKPWQPILLFQCIRITLFSILVPNFIKESSIRESKTTNS